MMLILSWKKKIKCSYLNKHIKAEVEYLVDVHMHYQNVFHEITITVLELFCVVESI